MRLSMFHHNSFTLIILFSCIHLVFGEIIPTDRRINWSAGISGGIPNYPVSVNVKDYGAHGNGSSDDAQAFKNAISAAPKHTAVFVPAGTYRLNSEVKITKPIVLRGEGADKTTLVGYATTGNADIIELSASSEGNNINITGGYTKGSTEITLAGTLGLSVGDYIVVFQDNNSLVDNLGRGWLGVDEDENHCMSQIVKITGINGNTVTINRPLYYTFESGNDPEAKKLDMLEGAGIENLSLQMNGVGGKRYNIHMTQCANCWVRNVESKYADWGHVKLNESFACEIRGGYFHHGHSYTSDRAYGVFLFGPNSDHLVEDNIIRVCRHSMIFEGGGSGCVFGYNYSDDSQGNVGDRFLFADISTHGAHPYMNLFEGNLVCHADFDYTHGSDSHNSLFRNHISGVSTPPDDNIIYGMRCIEISKKNWYANVVGNVLGTYGQTYVAYEDNGTRSTSSKYIYNFGYSSDGDQSSDDPNSKNTAIRHGNYDYFSNSVKWDSGISDRTIPSSYYLSSKPSFFGDLPWPAIGPDLNPIIGVIPAKKRYDNGTYISTNTPVLAVASTSLPNAVAGLAYNQSLDATGGTETLSWSVASGSLPTGLGLNSNGVINGVPTQAGLKTFTIQVTDANDSVAIRKFSLSVLNEDNVNLANGTTHISNSQNFSANSPVKGLWDGDVSGSPAGSPGNSGIDSFWVEFDLSKMYDLSLIRFYGNAEGTWMSKTYNVLIKANETDLYTPVTDHENCLSNNMYQTVVSSISARYIKLVVVGDTDVHATRCREFEVFGKPSPTMIAAHEGYLGNDNNPLQVSGKDIRYSLSNASHVQISIYDVSGKVVRELVNEKQAAGAYQIRWQTEDNFGNGIYLCRMKMGNELFVNKIFPVR